MIWGIYGNIMYTVILGSGPTCRPVQKGPSIGRRRTKLTAAKPNDAMCPEWGISTHGCRTCVTSSAGSPTWTLSDSHGTWCWLGSGQCPGSEHVADGWWRHSASPQNWTCTRSIAHRMLHFITQLTAETASSRDQTTISTCQRQHYQ